MSPYMVKRLVGFATVIGTMVLVCLVTVVMIQTVQLGKLNNESKALDIKIDRLVATRVDLENGIAERNTEQYVEDQARENLGMIKEGDVIFVFE